MAAVEEYTICVFLRQLRNASLTFKHMIDWTGKSAHLQLEGDAKVWYENDAANDRKF